MGEDGNNTPAIKRFLFEVKPGKVPQTIWEYDEVGHTQDAKKELIQIMGFAREEDVFITPKPVALIERVIELATQPDSLVLDSFAGSGTTAHAVLSANAKDGGNRRFILVEFEDYADTLTAERVRRAINGYSFQGIQREELLREQVTFSTLRRSNDVLNRITAIENLEGYRFSDIRKQVKDGVLTVVGETKVSERTDGLPGGFTYCNLGPPLDLDSLLSGGEMPTFNALGSWLFYTATGTALDPERLDQTCGFLGEGGGWAVSMIFRPDRAWLESPAAALTLDQAKTIAAAHPGTRKLIFAAVSYAPSRVLDEIDVTYVPLPFALFRVEQQS